MKRHGSKASAPAERGANSSMRHELLKRERGAKVSGAASRTFGGPPPGRAVAATAPIPAPMRSSATAAAPTAAAGGRAATSDEDDTLP